MAGQQFRPHLGLARALPRNPVCRSHELRWRCVLLSASSSSDLPRAQPHGNSSERELPCDLVGHAGRLARQPRKRVAGEGDACGELRCPHPVHWPLALCAGAHDAVDVGGRRYIRIPTTPSEYAVEKQTYAIIPGMDIVWIAKPLSNSAREFQVDSSSSATSSWTALALFYEGLDANTETGLHVEVLSHFELLPSTGGTLTHASTPAAKSNPGIITSVSNALLSLPSSMEKFGDAVHSAGQLAQVLRSYRTQPLMLMNS